MLACLGKKSTLPPSREGGKVSRESLLYFQSNQPFVNSSTQSASIQFRLLFPSVTGLLCPNVASIRFSRLSVTQYFVSIQSISIQSQETAQRIVSTHSRGLPIRFDPRSHMIIASIRFSPRPRLFSLRDIVSIHFNPRMYPHFPSDFDPALPQKQAHCHRFNPIPAYHHAEYSVRSISAPHPQRTFAILPREVGVKEKVSSPPIAPAYLSGVPCHLHW